MKCTNTEDFIQKAKEIHGDKYDYSEFTYTKMQEKSTIICPLHGKFEQTPSQHLTKKCGCSKCARIKAQQTKIERYGTLKNFISPEAIKRGREKAKQTMLERYGVPYYSQTQEAREHMSKVISSEECQNKTKQTNLIKYGTECTYNLEKARKRLHEVITSEEYKEKRRAIANEVYAKGFETRRKNHSLNTSTSEEYFNSQLLNYYTSQNVLRNHTSDLYPYHCDFYIPCENKYIELNLHWSHGQHEFNPNNQEDIKKLQQWKEKADMGHKAYQGAIRLWTVTDKEKIQTANANQLDYVILWNKKDIKNYLDTLKNQFTLIDISELKICDFLKKGNVIRLYLTWFDDNDYWGDDWDDVSFEHNAGTVYGGAWYIEIAFPLAVCVVDPSDDWHYNGNSPYCKEDFKRRTVPCIIVGYPQNHYSSHIEYSEELNNNRCTFIYFNDSLSNTLNNIKQYGGVTILKHYWRKKANGEG